MSRHGYSVGVPLRPPGCLDTWPFITCVEAACWPSGIQCRPSTPFLSSLPFLPHMSNEQTYIMIKPDGVQRGLVGKIIQRFEDRGYQLVAMKLVQAGEDHLEKHYKDLKGKPFFPGLIKYMASGPVVAMVWQGKDVVKQGRALLGATNPLASAPGTIRGDFCIDVGRNICHGSDSVESAKAEIALWFGEQDATISYPRAVDQWIYE